ncbi:MAG: hypothetical protein GY854_12425 [Deltaproteobacteria bacterium]|nr:hypothetical protein [Deltaproteobacteria bacterium]
MEVLFVMVFVVAVICVALYYDHKENQKRAAVWSEVADRLGVTFTPGGGGKISGSIDGVFVSVDIHNEGSGKNSTTYTRYRAAYPDSLPFGLQISSEGFFSDVVKFFGSQDIEVGDEIFDNAYMIKGDDPGAVIEYLTERRKNAIDRVFARFNKAAVDSSRVEGMALGQEKNPSKLIFNLKMAFECANVLGGRPSNMNRVDEPVAHATVTLPEIDEPTADAVTVDSEPSVLPAAVFARVADEPVVEPVFVSQAESSNIEPAGPSVTELCSLIFDGDSFGSETEKQFEQFKGRTIKWSGILKNVQSFRFDFVFGDGEGTKAVVEVFELTSSLGTKSKVKAVVQLPSDDYERLASSKGEPCEFIGTLFQIKGMMKEVYIKDGKVL